MLNSKLFITLIVCAGLGACEFDTSGESTGSTGSPLHMELLERESLDLKESSLIGISATDNYGNDIPCIHPSVQNGTAVLRTTESGLLIVEDLTINLNEIHITPGLFGNQDILIKNISLHLGTQLVILPHYGIDGEFATGQGNADLLLDWSFRSNSGNTYPLATQRVRDVEFTVEVKLADDGSIQANVDATIPGLLGSFANRVAISDLSVAVKAKSSEF